MLPRSTVKSDEPITLAVMLNWSDAAGFEAYGKGIGDPTAPNYRHNLSLQQINERFGPTQEAYDRVLACLQSQGFRPASGLASSFRLVLTLQGTRAAAERAFAINLNNYQVRGRTFFANDTEPSLPAEIGPFVHAISGLSNFSVPRPLIVPQYPLLVTTAYNAAGLPPGINGSGQTVGLIELDNCNLADVNQWITQNNVPAKVSQVSVIPFNGGTAPSGGDGNIEACSNIDTVLGVAPGVNVFVFVGPSGTPLTAMVWGALVNISNSGVRSGPTSGTVSLTTIQYEDEVSDSDADFMENILRAYTVAGVSFFVGSGDLGGPVAMLPADAPDAIAVGGTMLQVGSGSKYQGESWWSDVSGAGGFGVSAHFPRPSYQDAFTATPGRSIPDVSADAEIGTGITICMTSNGSLDCSISIGGTSFATPVWAAIWALACQASSAPCGSANGGYLYGWGRGWTAPIFFHPPGSMTGPGNDFAHVGLGSPNITNLVALVAGTPVVSGIKGQAWGPVTGGTQVTLNGQRFIGVTGVEFSNAWTAASAASFTVNSVNSITVVSPSLQNGDTVDITVTTMAGTSARSNADHFTYNPVVTSITPMSGPMSGGTAVTITGQGLSTNRETRGTQVYFGGISSHNVYCQSSTQCVAASPPEKAGTVPVMISVLGVETQIGQFTYLSPTINSTNPSIGPETGGTSVDLSGESFAPGMTVLFQNTQTKQSTPVNYVLCSSDTWCTIKTPAGTGAAEIIATVNGITSTPNPPNDIFTYKPFPAVASIAPAVGPATGGTQVAIVGTNFSPNPSIQFGPNPATKAGCVSVPPQRIFWECTATSPAGSQTVDLTVTANGLTSLTNPADKFSYIPVVTGITPNAGPQTGGTKVSITGAGFARTRRLGDTSVSFGGNPVPPSLVSCTDQASCSVISPATKLSRRPGGVDIQVTVGSQTSPANPPADVFVYTAASLSGWTQWYPSTSPPGGVGRNLIYDASRDVMLYFGSSTLRNPVAQTWTWDGGAWTQSNPVTNPIGRSGAFAFDAARGMAVLFGGFDARTWLWDGSNWKAFLPSNHPSPRAGASMTYDATRQVIVLFGGCANASCGALLNDTWTWDGSNWTQQSPSATPPARSGAYFAYDGAAGTAVLFGGVSGSAPLNDTWAWTGTQWTQLHPSTSPSPRQGCCMTYDPVMGGLVLFGVTGGSASDMWSWKGSTWSQLPLTGPHPDGSGVVMDYNGSLGAIVLLGLDGSTWTWQK
jgi:hypothetical protein